MNISILGTGNNLITSRMYWRLNENWGLQLGHNFEARNGKLEEQFYTLYRDFRSWTGALTFRVNENSSGADDYAIALTFSLKAMPRFGLGGEQSHRSSWSFDADHPEIFASEDNGVTPVEFVLVGLASCLTAGVAAVAQNRGIQLNSVKATIEGDMDILGILGGDPEVRNGFTGIRVHYDIDADATREDIEALVAQSQKRSAVFDVVTNPTSVTVEVN